MIETMVVVVGIIRSINISLFTCYKKIQKEVITVSRFLGNFQSYFADKWSNI